MSTDHNQKIIDILTSGDQQLVAEGVEALNAYTRTKIRNPPLHVTGITNCARCGCAHENLEFKEMAQPLTLYPDTSDVLKETIVFTHWCPCPTNGDPILLLSEPDEKEQKSG